MLSGNTIKGAPQLEQITWDDLDKRKYYIWGPTTFLFVRAIVYPSNLVKTRLQVQSSAHPLYKGTFDAFGKIFRQEGVAGLYKGFGASTVNVAVGNIYITVYELTRKFFLQNSSFSDKAANFVGGACASLVSQTVVVPLDIVSQRMMISGQGMSRNQSRQHDRGFFSVIKHIYQRKGLRGFYKGYLPSVATYAPSSSIWWGSYGLLLPIYYNLLDSWNLEPFVQQIVAQAIGGGSAGIITAVATNPMDMVRTRTQIYTEYGAIDTIKYIIDRNGLRGLMTGVSARVLAMGPSGVMMVSAYEFVKRKSKKTPIEDENN